MAIEGLNDIMKADSARSTKMDCTKSVEEYINREDWRIAANSNTTYSQAGLVNNLSGKAIANFFLDKLYTKKEGDSHRKGEYHIHDLDVLAAYCCGHDLQKLLNEGFNGVPGRVGSKAPKHVREALYQMANYIGVLQAEWAGAQAFSSFDTYLAPLYFFDCLFNGVGYDELKKAVANFVYNLNVPSRWGQCVPEHCRCLKADGSWVNGHFLKVGDEIAVVDGGKLSKARVEAVNFFDAPAVMHEYSDGLGRRFLVTPNHRVMVLEDGKPVLRESADILAAGKAVTIPLTRTDRPSADEPDGPVSDEILALAAMAACRGHFGGLGSFAMFKDLEDAIANGRGLTLIVNAPDEGSPLAVQIEEVLDAAAPGSWRRLTAADSSGQYLVNGGAAAEVARLCASLDGGWLPMNRLERLVGMLSARQALIFLDTWCRFAGTMDAKRGAWVLDAGGTGFPGGFIDNLWEIRQKALLTAAVKAGKAGAAMFSEEWGEDGCRGRHAVSILGNEASAEFTVREVPGSGKVWCPTTAAGTFVASPDMTRSDTELEDSTLTESSSFVFATGNSPFSNVTIDLKCPADLRERNPMRENKPLLVSIHDEYAERLKGDADLAARWERVVAELRRRLVAEDPSMADADEETLLYSACYRHFDPEMKQVFRAYYEVLGEGDAFGLPFTFPIPTVNITEDFDWDNPDYDVIWNETATYGSSYFQNFVGSQYKRDADGKLTIRDENAFSPGDVRSMAFHPMSHFEARVEGVHCMVTAREVYASVKAGLKVELRSDTHEFAPITEAFEIDYSQYGGIMHQIVLHGGSLCEPFMVSVDHKCLVVEDGKRVETVSQNVRPGHGMLVRDKATGKLVERKVAANVRVKTDIKKVYNFTIDTEAHLVELANGVVSPQCCRLQLDKSQLRKRGGGLFGSDSQTGCYDDKTEVLTDSGWKLFRDVLPKDGIVTLDHDGRRRIQHAVRRFDTPYRGEMIRFEGEGVDLLVTPNHNMLDFRDDGMRFVTAENASGLRVRTESPDGVEGGAALYSEVRPVERVPYEGRIYCLEVPNHTLLVRRNGKACWCGNSVGVVTINLARLGYEHRGDMKGLKDKLFKLMDRAKSTLEKKRAFVKEMCLRGLYPYTRRYITSSLDGFSTFFTTIGVNGMNECIRNFTDDAHDITDEYGQEFAKGLLADVNARLLKYQEETGNLYNLEATPGEGCLAYDTGILTIDGPKPIGSLAGSRVPVLSWNKDTKAYEYKEADIVLDSVSEDIYRVEFDNGFSLVCTSQHPFGVRHWNGKNGEEVCWVTAEDLKVGDRIKSVYPHLSQRGYVKYGHNFFLHRERYAYINGEIPSGYVVHHKNHNKLDNSIENLELMEEREHKRHHLADVKRSGKMATIRYGEDNPFWGKTHSAETRKRISDSRCEMDEETKVNVVDAYTAGLEFKQISRWLGLTSQPNDYIRSCGLAREGAKKSYPPKNANAVGFLYDKGCSDEQIVDILRGHNDLEFVRDTILGLVENNHKVVSVERLHRRIEVFNAMVKDNRNFFVGDDESGYVLTHNTTYRFAKEDQKAFGTADKVYVNCPEHGLREVDADDGADSACPECGAALQARRGIIQAGVPEAPYYTNSSQLPADFGEDVFSALDLQDDLQKCYTGGTVFHIYCDEQVDGPQVKALIRKVVENYRLPYISFTASFSTCPKHGRIPGLHEFCPLCDSELLARHYAEYDPNKK